MKIAMIILAAGLSKRMGVFKPLLPVGVEPAILRCVRTAKSAGMREIIVVTGHRDSEIRDLFSRVDEPGVTLVHNDRYIDGMFTSVCAGVSALAGDIDGFFLQPSDCCAVVPETLTDLIDEFAKTGKASVTRPVTDGRRGHPPLIPARFIGDILAYSGDGGLKEILATLPSVTFEVQDRAILMDMDTPEDYAALLEHLGLPTYPAPGECARLLEECGTRPDIVQHGEDAAALALKIARLMGSYDIVLALLESACLLHDILRLEPDHAKAGGDFLLRKGYPKAAILVATHMDLPDKPAEGIDEAQLVYLADKLCRRGTLVKLEDTLREMTQKFSDNPASLAHIKRRIGGAQAIMDMLRTRHGIDYDDIF